MKLINSDCIAAMKEMPDNSVDSIVTDPPYELGFMGKSWDSTGIAFNVEVWQEALRVLKPGGHLLAFSGSRTYHRMAVAIEDAGFQIRDQIMWIYGSGFPKSMNVAKAIEATLTTGNANKTQFKKLQGKKTKRCDPNGFYAANKLHNNRPADYTEIAEGDFLSELEPTTAEAKQWQGWGTALKPAHEPLVLARKPIEGTIANNVLTHGVGGLNIDGTRVGTEVLPQQIAGQAQIGTFERDNMVTPERTGRWPANVIHDGSDEVVALFPNVKGQVGMTKNVGGHRFIVGDLDSVQKFTKGTTDSGSAARFFYCAKASKKDRNDAKVNHHPTVKPTDLMRYLCRLITPPQGIVLDPFMGSGSTGKGAILEGFDFIGIEQDADYMKIAQARIEFAINKSSETLL